MISLKPNNPVLLSLQINFVVLPPWWDEILHYVKWLVSCLATISWLGCNEVLKKYMCNLFLLMYNLVWRYNTCIHQHYRCSCGRLDVEWMWKLSVCTLLFQNNPVFVTISPYRSKIWAIFPQKLLSWMWVEWMTIIYCNPVCKVGMSHTSGSLVHLRGWDRYMVSVVFVGEDQVSPRLIPAGVSVYYGSVEAMMGKV